MAKDFMDNKTVQFAYSTIHEFFDCYDIADALKVGESIFLAAAANKIWKNEAPYHLLLYMQKLHEILNAAITIHYQNAFCRIAVLKYLQSDTAPDMSCKKAFVSHRHGNNNWSCFPRHLTQKQYANPYRAIKKVADYKSLTEWKMTLKTIEEYALSNNPIDGEMSSYQLLKIRKKILQLIEACHLIEVRTSRKQK